QARRQALGAGRAGGPSGQERAHRQTHLELPAGAQVSGWRWIIRRVGQGTEGCAVEFGIVVFNGCATSPAALGRAVEARGSESLFDPEHPHIPVASRRADGRSTRGFAETWDPFVALALVAGVTSRLRIGTAVCLVPQRDPIITAKEVASLDLA